MTSTGYDGFNTTVVRRGHRTELRAYRGARLDWRGMRRRRKRRFGTAALLALPAVAGAVLAAFALAAGITPV